LSIDMTVLAIETGIEPDYENALIAAAEKAGWDTRVVRHVPFSHVFEDLDEDFVSRSDVWFHGAIEASKTAQKETSWQVHAPWEELKCSSYYPKLQERILQKDHAFTTIEQMELEFYTQDFVEDETLFFRPDTCDKIFNGGCISIPDFDSQYRLVTFYEPDPDSVVVCARPQKISAEARFLIVNGELITGSYYKTGGNSIRLKATDSLMDIAQDFLNFCLSNDFDPAPSWVLDLAETSESWSIIEVGATSCCGLYKCDMDLFIEALSKLDGL
jgi:hypothetical protein